MDYKRMYEDALAQRREDQTAIMWLFHSINQELDASGDIRKRIALYTSEPQREVRREQ